jgi:translation initiation factor 2B subunit (eIF-2B alpha/beta/delta family)
MNPVDAERLHALLRYHAHVIGAARMTVLGLNALVRAFETVTATPAEMIRLFDQVLAAVRDTRPKLIALIDLVGEVREELRPYLDGDDPEALRTEVVRRLRAKVELYEEHAAAVVRHGLEHVADGDRILVHSAGSVVTNILVEAARDRRRSFEVLVLEHDPVRTPRLARCLEAEGVPHRVLPMYDLCHVQHEIDKLFLGALTVTPDRKAIAPVGTASVVSICHVAGFRVYLFANSLHYSRGVAASQQIHVSSPAVPEDAQPDPHASHSHDLVDLRLFDVIVNEYGVTSLDVIGTERARHP